MEGAASAPLALLNYSVCHPAHFHSLSDRPLLIPRIGFFFPFCNAAQLTASVFGSFSGKTPSEGKVHRGFTCAAATTILGQFEGLN